MFVRGIIDRLDKTRLSRFASHASGFSGSQATVYMHKAYLEQTILILNALSFLVCLGSFAAVPFLEIQLFTRNSTDCKIENDVHCFALNTTVKWSAYSFSTGGHYLLPLLNHMIDYTKENISLPVMINDAMKDLQLKWTKYQTIWPLDLICCLNALLLDFIRRFRRMKRLIYDSAPMFCMGLMLFAIGKHSYLTVLSIGNNNDMFVVYSIKFLINSFNRVSYKCEHKKTCRTASGDC
ncbi:hypothetical protein AHF37_12045 [Paragonimus kellicotti]|nr:hypothetical protein AHF37_12045 [Paragonimus kellicotti]